MTFSAVELVVRERWDQYCPGGVEILGGFALQILGGNSQTSGCRERHMSVFTTEFVSDLGSCLEI